MENSIADGMELNPGPEIILDENWDTIVRVARLFIERGVLSRSELEGEVFEPDEGGSFRRSPSSERPSVRRRSRNV
jgi:hypothetical protein